MRKILLVSLLCALAVACVGLFFAASRSAARQEPAPKSAPQQPNDGGFENTILGWLEQPRDVFLGLGSLVLVFLAGGGYWLFLRRWRPVEDGAAGVEQLQRRLDQQQLQTHYAVAAVGAGGSHASGINRYPAPRKPTLDEVAEEVERLTRWRETAGTELRNILRMQEEFNTRLDGKLNKFLTSVEVETGGLIDGALREFSARQLDHQNRLNEIEANIAGIRTELHGLANRTGSEIMTALQRLPRFILQEPAAASTPEARQTLTKRFDQALASYFSSTVSNLEALEPIRARVEEMHAALEQFRAAVPAQKLRQSESSLADAAEDLSNLRSELDGLRSSHDQRRIRLMFAVDLTAHEASQQAISQALVAGLQREIVKLDSPVEYYEKRVRMASARLACAAADLADTQVDPERSKEAVQAALHRLFDAARLQPIDPQRNEPFQPKYHAMLQLARRSAADRSGGVADVVVRGFRDGEQMVRKATVVLFE